MLMQHEALRAGRKGERKNTYLGIFSENAIVGILCDIRRLSDLP